MKNQKGSVLPIIILLVLITVAAYGYFSLGKENSLKLLDTAKQLVSNVPEGAKTTTINPSSEALVMITEAGFIPATITVARGQQVSFVNSNGSSHQVISQELDLDSDVLQASDSFTTSFEKSGTFSYRDRLNLLKYRGTVIVE